MVHETSKATARRLHDSRFVTRYFVGDGIDIGSGDDSLAKHAHLFPLIRNLRSWDISNGDGDAQLMEGIEPAVFDFVYSSHTLEHLQNPSKALQRWLYILKPHGHLILVVPDEDLYEQGQWPSVFNHDHKWSFNILKPTGEFHSVGVMDLLFKFAYRIGVIKIELLDHGYIYGAPLQDQSLSVACEPAIEIIIRKLPYG